MDGICAAAIVYDYYIRHDYCLGGVKFKVDEYEFIPMNYKDEFPFDKITQDELVVIVDFSLQKEGDFQKLLDKTRNVIWIDHHISAINKHPDINAVLKGIRRDGTAGCELAWEYFYPSVPVPEIVELIGDYDVWAFKYGDRTNYLQTGIRLYNTNPEDDNWISWLSRKHDISLLIREGEIALQYRDNYYADLIKSWSFFTVFEGYKAIACNAGSVSSQLFDSVQEEYDLMMPFVFDGKQWTVSIYTKRDDIDCSRLAEKYGGGGHRKASGFQVEELPFGKVEIQKIDTSKGTKYEISNPSDQVFIDCDNFEATCLAVVMLGEGQYGLEGIDNDRKMPVFLFGGHDEFFLETFGKDFEGSLNAMPHTELVKAFDGVYMEHERTSLNDIVGRAKQLAELHKGKVKEDGK
jgi:oligoribonuclease NrnB/cAMP/cGMP phosphodiesterase (DHH superfamily)